MCDVIETENNHHQTTPSHIWNKGRKKLKKNYFDSQMHHLSTC